MSKMGIKGEICTKFKEDQFLYFADSSLLGMLLIQRGFIKYFNKRFSKIFGYSDKEISEWKKREFYKIIHPEDLKRMSQNFKLEGENMAFVHFRGVTKKGKIINIENYVTYVKYNNKTAFLSTYSLLDKESLTDPTSLEITIKFEGDWAKKYLKYFKFLQQNFNINIEKYVQYIIKGEINSRIRDLGLF